MRLVLTALVVVVSLAMPLTTQAQVRSAERGLSVGVERLFGFFVGQYDRDVGDRDYTGFHLLWAPQTLTPVQAPRGAVDYFVIDNLSIGSGVGLAFLDQEENDGVGVILAPRVGYYLAFNDAIGFWPRGGFTFYTLGDDPVDITQFMLTLEAIFGFGLGGGWAVVAGPTFDIAIDGEIGEADADELSFGLMAGLVGTIPL